VIKALAEGEVDLGGIDAGSQSGEGFGELDGRSVAKVGNRVSDIAENGAGKEVSRVDGGLGFTLGLLAGELEIEAEAGEVVAEFVVEIA